MPLKEGDGSRSWGAHGLAQIEAPAAVKYSSAGSTSTPARSRRRPLRTRKAQEERRSRGDASDIEAKQLIANAERESTSKASVV